MKNTSKKEIGKEIISTTDITKSFGKFQALKGITSKVYEKEVVVVFGPSGSGKSTYIRTLNRLEPHDSGQITIDGVELNDDKCNQLWIPPGFAHGFQVISDVSLVNYKCSLNYWSPDDENIVLYNDPEINIKWPIDVGIISKKDKEGKFLRKVKNLPTC